VLLAVGAAFLFALAAYLQQRASRRLAERAMHGISGAASLTWRMLRNKTWLVGWSTNLCGWFTQAIALRLGSVAAVQPLISTQLLFALPLASIGSRTWPSARDWLAGLSVCAGIAVLLAGGGAAPLGGSADRPIVVAASVAAAAAILVLVRVSRGTAPRVTSVLTGCAAGICFAMSAVYLKLTADELFDRGVGATALDWCGYALAISTALGLVLGQASYASGPLPWALAAMNVTNPVVSYAVGCLAFHATPPTNPSTLAELAFAGALLLAGALGLAFSPSVDIWAPATVAGQPSARRHR
jgi:drug/metabolite transporter (DMT)-like permease